MQPSIERREFLQLTVLGTALGLGGFPRAAWAAAAAGSRLISPGCRRSKVKVARIYLGNPAGGWPLPKAKLNLEEDVRSYQPAFDALKDELADVEFFVDQLVTRPAQVEAIQEKLKQVDGILVIHLSIGIMPMLNEILAAGRPTVVLRRAVFRARVGLVRRHAARRRGREPGLPAHGRSQATGGRHPARSAPAPPARGQDPQRDHAHAGPVRRARCRPSSARRSSSWTWTAWSRPTRPSATPTPRPRPSAGSQAPRQVVEPTREEIFKSCKLALAFERLLAEEDATVMTVDCYGSDVGQDDQAARLPVPGLLAAEQHGAGRHLRIGPARRHDAHHVPGAGGQAGLHQRSDGRRIDQRHHPGPLPGHDLRMDGPGKPPRRTSCAASWSGRKAWCRRCRCGSARRPPRRCWSAPTSCCTSPARSSTPPTWNAAAAPRSRSRSTATSEQLWRNWTNGLHRVTCYGDLTKDLTRFCRFAKVNLVNEAA